MNRKMKLYQTAFHQCQAVFSNTRIPDRHFCLWALLTHWDIFRRSPINFTSAEWHTCICTIMQSSPWTKACPTRALFYKVFFNLLGLHRTYRYNIWCLRSSQSKDFSTVNPSPAFHQPIVCALALISKLPSTSAGQHPVSWALGTKCPPAIKYNDKTEELCSKASRDTPHLRPSWPPPYGDTRAKPEVGTSGFQGDLCMGSSVGSQLPSNRLCPGAAEPVTPACG